MYQCPKLLTGKFQGVDYDVGPYHATTDVRFHIIMLLGDVPVRCYGREKIYVAKAVDDHVLNINFPFR
jgi:hypothetical protein